MIGGPAMEVYPSESEHYGASKMASGDEVFPASLGVQNPQQSFQAGANKFEFLLSRLSLLAQQAQHVEQFLQTQLQQQNQVRPHDRQACDNAIHSILNEIILIGSSILSKNPLSQQNIEISTEQKVNITVDEVIDMDEDDILAEHSHFCQICGKGFRRDANVRMHMRAHGNQYKTAEALMSRIPKDSVRERKYSCPVNKCRRNRFHPKFRPLKSVVSLRNHYKRNHCPKMYSCNKCGKEFSVVADLKTHGKNCGHNRWRCSCGTTFIRKDKLFGHVALFEGHKPLLPDNSTTACKVKSKAKDCDDPGVEMAGKADSSSYHLGEEILNHNDGEELIMLGLGSNNAQFKFQIEHENQIGLLYEDDDEESDDSRKMYESMFWPELSADMFNDAPHD